MLIVTARLAESTIYFFALLFVSLYFNAEGEGEAEELMEGERDFQSTITLDMRDGTSPFEGKTYVLVISIDDRYYLLDQHEPTPATPMLYVVPASEVVSARVQQMDK